MFPFLAKRLLPRARPRFLGPASADRRHSVLTVAATAMVALWSLVLCAQPPRNRPPAPPPAAPVACELEGTIAGYDQGVLQVVDAQQQAALVAIDPQKTSVIVTGTAEPGFLRAGLFVRFSSELDASGAAPVELSELQVFTPRDASSLGVTNENPTSTTGPFDVSGQIRTLKKGKLVVDAGEAEITVRLVAEPIIKIKVGDISWATIGDPIKVRGRWVAPGQATADVVEVELREPLAGPKKKRGRGSRKPSTAPAASDRPAS